MTTIVSNGTAASQPILSMLVRQFEVEVNILNANIETIGGAILGLPLGLLLVITGPQECLPNPSVNQVLGSIVNAGRA